MLEVNWCINTYRLRAAGSVYWKPQLPRRDKVVTSICSRDHAITVDARVHKPIKVCVAITKVGDVG